MESATRNQTLDEAVFTSLCANAIGEGMNPFFFNPELWVSYQPDWDHNLGNQSKRRKTLDTRLAVLQLKIDLLSDPDRGGEVN